MEVGGDLGIADLGRHRARSQLAADSTQKSEVIYHFAFRHFASHILLKTASYHNVRMINKNSAMGLSELEWCLVVSVQSTICNLNLRFSLLPFRLFLPGLLRLCFARGCPFVF